ncbi:MAG TPA: hypothetical protein PKE66_04375 [Pyrinomonadaceae bacterium]|nr:hypothetical protein [Pyrinomonadaceae bacterium]
MFWCSLQCVVERVMAAPAVLNLSSEVAKVFPVFLKAAELLNRLVQ